MLAEKQRPNPRNQSVPLRLGCYKHPKEGAQRANEAINAKRETDRDTFVLDGQKKAPNVPGALNPRH